MLDPAHEEGEGTAEVRADQFETRMAVEHSGEDEAEQGHGILEHIAHCGDHLQIGQRINPDRLGRVNEEGKSEGFQSGEYRLEARIIGRPTLQVRIEQEPLQSEFVNRVIDFAQAWLHGRERENAQSDEAVGMALNRPCDEGVGLAGDLG